MKDEKKNLCERSRSTHTHRTLWHIRRNAGVSANAHTHHTLWGIMVQTSISIYVALRVCDSVVVRPSSIRGRRHFPSSDWLLLLPIPKRQHLPPNQTNLVLRSSRQIQSQQKTEQWQQQQEKNCGITELQIANVCVTIDCLRWAVVVKPAAATSHHTTDNRCQCTSTYNHYECVAGADLCMNQMALERKIEKNIYKKQNDRAVTTTIYSAQHRIEALKRSMCVFQVHTTLFSNGRKKCKTGAVERT